MREVKHVLLLLLGLIGAILLVAMFVIGRAVIVVLAPFVAVLVVLVLAYVLVASVAGTTIHLWIMGRLKAERYRMQTKTLHPTGPNYPVIYEAGQMVQTQPGVVAQPVPHTYSPHITYNYRESSTRVTEEEQNRYPELTHVWTSHKRCLVPASTTAAWTPRSYAISTGVSLPV